MREKLFILDDSKTKVIDYFDNRWDLGNKYPTIQYSSLGGCWGFSIDKDRYYFLNYLDFQTEDYKKRYPNPIKPLITATNFLRKEKINALLKSNI